MALVANECRRRGRKMADRNRAQRQEGNLDARSAAASVDHVHHQDAPRELLAERREAVPFGQHVGRQSQRARGCRGHPDLQLPRTTTRTDSITAAPCAQSANPLCARSEERRVGKEWILRLSTYRSSKREIQR